MMMCDDTRWPFPATDPITVVSTTAEVRQWLEAAGFGSSSSALAGVDGHRLLAMTEEELKKLTPDGAAIYAALHGLQKGALGSHWGKCGCM